jgi:hypothetical protein
VTFERPWVGTVFRLSAVRAGIEQDVVDLYCRDGNVQRARFLPSRKAPGHRHMPKDESPEQSNESEQMLGGMERRRTSRRDRTPHRIGGGLGAVVAKERRSHQP